MVSGVNVVFARDFLSPLEKLSKLLSCGDSLTEMETDDVRHRDGFGSDFVRHAEQVAHRETGGILTLARWLARQPGYDGLRILFVLDVNVHEICLHGEFLHVLTMSSQAYMCEHENKLCGAIRIFDDCLVLIRCARGLERDKDVEWLGIRLKGTQHACGHVT